MPILALLAGCVPRTAGIPVMTCPTIPKPRVSVGPPKPRPETPDSLALSPGHWEWGVGSYDWMPPDWLPRPPHPLHKNAPVIWQGGYWTPNGGACVWTAGRFVS